MAGLLLETKLHVPRRRPGLVSRPRLRDVLSRSADSALTLASAPAGFGKTTLLADWMHVAATQGQTVAWVSLDERDNEPSVFWGYVITALQRAAPDVGGDALAMLATSRSDFEPAMASLLNDLLAAPRRVALILDDYHTIEAREIHEQVAYLVEHLPGSAHLVIATRFDPPLPLARWRARGELVEIRAADLRFTNEEVATYLDAMSLGLEDDAVEVLVEHTEGWIAALQLAALSMQGRDDVTGFIASFAGDDRFVVDYLVAEVLQRQPAVLRDFLLQTSILRRMNGSLCDAVTGQDSGKQTLEDVERANLFVIALDDRREWYRYHHLFAEMLRVRLLDEQPELARELHQRACRWYEQHGELPEAIHHALASDHHERAAGLIELAAYPLRQARQEATLRGWLERLPEDVFRDRPVLSTLLVGVLMASGEIEGVEARLADAERWIDGTGELEIAGPQGEPIVVDEVEFRRLPSQVAVYRAAQARVYGDDAGTIAHALRAMDLAADDDHLGQGAASGLLGLAHWTLGDLDGAHAHYSNAVTSLQRAGHHSDVLGCTLALGDILRARGQLGAALHTYEHGLVLAAGHDGTLRGTADLHVGIAEVLIERDDIDGALAQLEASTALGEHAHLPQQPYRWRVAMAAIRRSKGDLDEAVGLLDDAERVFDSDLSPPVRPVAAARARVRLARGEIGGALQWAAERHLGVEDELSYGQEFEHITFAGVLLARHAAEHADRDLDDAVRLLERLLLAAELGQRNASIIEILALQSLAHEAKGEAADALSTWERAVALAEPEGFVRVFSDLPSAVVAMPGRHVAVGNGHAQPSVAASGPATLTARRAGELADPLSARELDVLRLLRTRLSGPEIAQELHVSLNTLRTHTQHIYTKLGANNRRAAIHRADQLGI